MVAQAVHESHLLTRALMVRGKMTLLAYETPNARYRTPVLIVPPLIGRPTVLDLAPGRSFIEALIARGLRPYLLDWGVFGYEDRTLGFGDLLETIHDAAERVRDDAASRGCTFLGYCMGGTLVASYAARAMLGEPDRIVTLAAPIDFRHGGRLARWSAPDVLDLERVLAIFGNVPATMIEAAFTLLRPAARVEAARKGAGDPAHAALAKWSRTWLDLPGEAARTWIVDLYRENRLFAGTLTIDGTSVRLRDITAPLLAIGADEDQIAPAAACAPIVDLVRSADRRFANVPGGHIALVAGSGARNATWPLIEEWVAARSTPVSR